MKEVWKYAFLIFIGLAIGFIISELAFRIYYHQKGIMPYITEDERCINNVYLNHRSLLESGNFNLENRKHITHSLLGWKPAPNFVEGRDSSFLAEGMETRVFALDTRYNSMGMRSGKEYAKDKPKNIFRISVLGDSSTHGVDVTQPFSYPAMLERLAKGTEVLNFGVSGYGTDQMYLRFLNETSGFENDAIIMGIFIDDIRRSGHTCKDYLKPKFDVKDGKLELTNTPVPGLQEFLEGYKRPVIESYFIKHFLSKIYFINLRERKYDEGFSITSLILDDMKKLTGEKKMFFMVAILSPNDETELMKEMRFRLRKMLESKGIDYIDSIDVFDEAYRGSYKNFNLYVSGHFNNLGNALMAQKIKNVLEEKKLIEKTPNYLFISNSFLFNEIMLVKNLETNEEIYVSNMEPISKNQSFEIPRNYIPFRLG